MLGSDKDHAISTVGTIDGCRCCVLQHINAFDVGRIEVIDVAASYSINNIDRLGITVGTSTTHCYFETITRLTGNGRNVHTRSFALQSTEHLSGIHLFDIFTLDLYSGTGDEFLLLHTITDDDNILKSLVVGLQRDCKVGLISDGDFLCLIAYIRHHEGSSRLDVQREVTIKICDCAVLGISLLHNTGTNDRTFRVNDVSGYFLCLLHSLRH